MLFVSMSVVIIVVLEELLLIIPNVQLTVFLILLFSSVYTLKESIVMIIVYVILDSLYMGTFHVLYMAPMILGWSLIPLGLKTILKNTNNELHYALFAFVFGFVYGWMFIPFKMIEQSIFRLGPYLIADLPFEIIMAVVGFLTVYYLYKPLRRILIAAIEGHELEKNERL
jgi:hypothetical protein